MTNVGERGRAALAAAASHEDEIVRFLREMIAIPAESLNEGDRCRRVLEEYERLGFDEARFDRLGNVVARLGELPAIACMAYGLRIAREHGLPDAVTVYLTASVMEEDCDGYCLLHLIEKEGIRPDVVVIGEPTDMGIYRGQRGRVEAVISARGVSSHAAHPEEGVNALYKLAPVLQELEALNERLPMDDFLGKGTVVASYLECDSASLNAVPAAARLYVDRRLTAGETPEAALAEIRALPGVGDSTVELLEYDQTSWTGERARQDKIFPAWVLPEEHVLVRSLSEVVASVTGAPPRISRWGFSTNGVATMGRHGIPSAGFAPGLEELSHTTEEWVAVGDLVTATAAYSLMPGALAVHADELSGG